MIASKISVQNFRCFEKITIDDLQQVNLIVGKNNVGKTALLETIFIMAGTSPELMLRTDVFRGMRTLNINLSGSTMTESPLNSFFHNFDSTKEIIIRAEHQDKWNQVIIKSRPPSTILMSTTDEDGRIALRGEQSRILAEFLYENSENDSFSNKLTLSPEKKLFSGDKRPQVAYETIFLHNVVYNPSEDANRLGSLLEMKKDSEVVEALKILEPRIKDIKIAPRAGEITILIDIGQPRLMPIALSGLGMMKLLRLIVNMLSVPGGILLIDEIEVGLHWRSFLSIWKVMTKLSKSYDVQVFATTHSRECLNAAVEAFSNEQEFNLGVFRLEQTKNGLQSIAYSKDTIKAAIDNDLEIR